jgi:nucleotide-binding universal stress UspA family protein
MLPNSQRLKPALSVLNHRNQSAWLGHSKIFIAFRSEEKWPKIVSTDFSAALRVKHMASFQAATELATRLQLEICLMHVVIRVYFGPPEGFLPVFSGNIPNQKQLWAEAGAQATQYFAGKVEQLRAQGVPRVFSVVIEGSAEGAAAEIIDRGSKTSNALVIMSTHGRSGIGRWLIGSVTERVVRHSPNPVLVTRSHPNGLGRSL